MNKFVLWLYVTGTVIIINAVFRAGFVEGLWIVTAGIISIFAAYYINKHTRRY